MNLPACLEAALADLRVEPLRLGAARTLVEQMERAAVPGVGLAVVAEGQVE